jgi:uncharacterized pyridoxamine 5'-phosphate oxidase family protein
MKFYFRFFFSEICPIMSILKSDDESVVKNILEKDGMELRNTSTRMKRNHDIVKTAIEQNGEAIKHALLVVNKELALIAVKNTYKAFYHLPNTLQSEEQIIEAALRNSGEIFSSLEMKFRENQKFATIAVSNYPDSWNYISKELKKNKEIAMLAVKQKGEMIGRMCLCPFYNDFDLNNEAMKSNPKAFKSLGHQYQNNISFLFQAMEVDASMILFSKFKKDRECVSFAVSKSPLLLKNLKDFHNDRRIVLIAARADIDILNFLEKFKQDSKFMLHVHGYLFFQDENMKKIFDFFFHFEENL